MKKALSLIALAIATFTGAALAADSYDVQVKGASGKAGSKAVAVVTVKAKGNFHVNAEYPHKLILTAPEGIAVEKAKITAADAKRPDEKTLVFEVAVTPAAAGKKTVEGELKFAVCSEQSCNPTTEKVSISVDAK
jgi:hypothetical protein